MKYLFFLILSFFISKGYFSQCSPGWVDLGGSSVTIYSGENYTITSDIDYSGSDVLTYNWSPGNEITPSITASPNTTSNYTLNVGDGNGCDTIVSIQIIVTPTSSSNTDTNICSDDILDLSSFRMDINGGLIKKKFVPMYSSFSL